MKVLPIDWQRTHTFEWATLIHNNESSRNSGAKHYAHRAMGGIGMMKNVSCYFCSCQYKFGFHLTDTFIDEYSIIIYINCDFQDELWTGIYIGYVPKLSKIRHHKDRKGKFYIYPLGGTFIVHLLLSSRLLPLYLWCKFFIHVSDQTSYTQFSSN